MLCYDSLRTSIQHKQVEENYSYLVDNTDINLGGNLRKHFYSAQPSDFITAAANSIPSVVSVTSENTSLNPKQNTPIHSSGSGVIISSKGHIVTNYHVINGAKSLMVIDNKGFEREGKVVGFDKSTDIAVIKIEIDNAPYFIFGNSDSLQVGEWVLAVGNPFKLQSSVTAGIVSAKGRDINLLERQGVESFIQTDAAINPGNSGGALVNSNGELVGINTAILSSSGSYEGFSFAIPSNIVRKVVYDIIEYGAVQRGWLGINILNITSDQAKSMNLSSNEGVLVELVESGSAAGEAGLRQMDIIASVNGIDTPTTSVFTEQVAQYRPGDKLKITYIRSGRKLETQVILRNQLNTTDYIPIRRDEAFANLGFEVRDLDSVEKQRLGKKQGVYVVTIYRGSIIHDTNMEPGFIITKFNNKPINTAQQLLDYLNSSKGTVFLEGFYEKYPGEYPYTFNLD